MDEIMYRVHAELEGTHWWFVAKNRILLHLIRHYRRVLAMTDRGIDSRPRALDVGCGAGGMLALLAPEFDAVGLDMSPIAREYCARRALAAVDGSLPDNVPFEQESFDVIVASEVLEHVQDDRGSVTTLCRLLRPGGLLLCTSPAHQWLWSQHDDTNQHKRRYSLRGFDDLFRGLPLNRLLMSYSMCVMFPVLAGLRIAGRSLGLTLGAGQGRSEDHLSVRTPAAPVNWALYNLFAGERWLLPRVNMPMGSSVISAHQRAATAR